MMPEIYIHAEELAMALCEEFYGGKEYWQLFHGKEKFFQAAQNGLRIVTKTDFVNITYKDFVAIKGRGN